MRAVGAECPLRPLVLAHAAFAAYGCRLRSAPGLRSALRGHSTPPCQRSLTAHALSFVRRSRSAAPNLRAPKRAAAAEPRPSETDGGDTYISDVTPTSVREGDAVLSHTRREAPLQLRSRWEGGRGVLAGALQSEREEETRDRAERGSAVRGSDQASVALERTPRPTDRPRF